MKENAGNLWNEILYSLTNYWQAFVLALPRIAFAVLLLLIAFFISRQITRVTKARLTSKANDPLFGRFIANFVKYCLYVCSFILFLHILGLSGIAGGLLAGAGVSALIFGFAFKDIAENFLAGIILAFDRPFSMNDTVRIGEHTGHIMALSVRTTHIKTFDEKDVFIPNGKIIREPLVNLTKDGLIRLEFSIGIAYEDDIKKALELIIQTAAGVEGVLLEKKPFAVVEELGVNTINIRLFFWSKTDDYKKGVLITKSTVIKEVKEALEKLKEGKFSVFIENEYNSIKDFEENLLNDTKFGSSIINLE